MWSSRIIPGKELFFQMFNEENRSKREAIIADTLNKPNGKQLVDAFVGYTVDYNNSKQAAHDVLIERKSRALQSGLWAILTEIEPEVTASRITLEKLATLIYQFSSRFPKNEGSASGVVFGSK